MVTQDSYFSIGTVEGEDFVREGIVCIRQFIQLLLASKGCVEGTEHLG